MIALIVFGFLGALSLYYQFCLKKEIPEVDVREEENSTEKKIRKVMEQTIPLEKKIEELESNYHKEGDLSLLIFSLLLDNRRLAHHAEMIFKNCSSLDETRVILMGEKHTISRHRSLEMYIISQWGKKMISFYLKVTKAIKVFLMTK